MQIICQICTVILLVYSFSEKYYFSFRRSIGHAVMHLTFTLSIIDKMYELHFSSKNLAPESEIRHLASEAGAVLPGVSLATHSLECMAAGRVVRSGHALVSHEVSCVLCMTVASWTPPGHQLQHLRWRPAHCDG